MSDPLDFHCETRSLSFRTVHAENNETLCNVAPLEPSVPVILAGRANSREWRALSNPAEVPSTRGQGRVPSPPNRIRADEMITKPLIAACKNLGSFTARTESIVFVLEE